MNAERPKLLFAFIRVHSRPNALCRRVGYYGLHASCLSRHPPKIAASAYIDPSAQVIGHVTVGERSSIWPNVTARGDVNTIRIGDDTNIQDNSVLHCDAGLFPLHIGNRVTVGHLVDAARLHYRR